MHQRNHRKLLNAFKATEGKFVPSVVFMERCFLSTRQPKRKKSSHKQFRQMHQKKLSGIFYIERRRLLFLARGSRHHVRMM